MEAPQAGLHNRAIMAVLLNDVDPRIAYVASAAQTTFVVPFEFFENSDLQVYVEDVLQTYSATPADATEYSVSGAGAEGGGSITFGAGRTTGDAVTILRDLPIERLLDFPTSGPFPIASLNLQLVKLFALLQELASQDTRQLSLAVTAIDGEGAYDVNDNRLSNV